MKKEIIIEINRGLEIMGLPQKKVINEQWYKFLRSIEDLLTNVSQDA